MPRRLLDTDEIEQSSIVANCTMNRLRTLDGYARELGFRPLDVLLEPERPRPARWLDLCCGSARALIEASRRLADCGSSDRVSITGVDLVGHFDPLPADLPSPPRLVEASAMRWSPEDACDLVTCVHGLHYLGDKLGLLERIASWLAPDGLFVGHLDLANLRDAEGGPATRAMARELRRAGFEVNTRHHRISLRGGRAVRFPFRWMGADDHAGPNVTGQPAVDSFYDAEPRRGR